MKLNTAVVIIAFCIHAVSCQTTSSPSNTTQKANTTTIITLSPDDYKKLETAVRRIVGPNIKPSPDMVELAIKQGGPPTKMDDMMSYISMMQKLARKNNINVPGVFGQATPDQIDTYVLEKAITWYQTKPAGTDPAPTPPPQTGNNMMDTSFMGPFDGINMATGNTYNQMQGNQELDLFTLMAFSNALGMENSLLLI